MTAQIGARFSAAKVASLGLALIAIGLALMLLSGVDSSWTVLLPGLLGDEHRHRPLQPDGERAGAGARCPTSRAASPRAPTTRSARPASPSGSPRSGPWCRPTRLGGDPQSYVDGLHNALIVAAAIAAIGAIATAWLLLPARPQAEADVAADAV